MIGYKDMNTKTVTFNRDVTLNELLEVKQLLEFQESNVPYTDTKLNIDGKFAKIEVDIDGWGNITVL